MTKKFESGVGSQVDANCWIYHYTSLEVAIEYILNSNTIKFGPLSEVNDPKESWLCGWLGGQVPVDGISPKDYVALEKKLNEVLRKRVKVFCVSKDKPEIKSSFDRGYMKPKMWDHYGDNSRGVCLVFDLEKFEAMARNAFDFPFYSGCVNYTNDAHKMLIDILSDEELKLDFDKMVYKRFENSIEAMLFTKHEDWSSENEFRMAFLDSEPGARFLNFENSLSAIIAGPGFPGASEELLKNAAISRDIVALKVRWNGASKLTSRIN